MDGSADRSVSAIVLTAVGGPPTSKLEIAVLFMCMTLPPHLPVISVTVAQTSLI